VCCVEVACPEDVVGGFDSDMCVELVELIDTCAGFWYKRGKKFVMRACRS
jgi:hypothetical protein